MTRLRIFLAALPLAATLAVAGAAGEAHALTNCTRLDGAQWTSGHCTGNSQSYPFMHAEQTCVLNYYTYQVQRGPSVGQNGYSSAGPCTSPIVNRKLVQTVFP